LITGLSVAFAAGAVSAAASIRLPVVDGNENVGIETAYKNIRYIQDLCLYRFVGGVVYENNLKEKICSFMTRLF
jgi:hypothetical protein